ncbi:AraC family transcriptional regulator [Aliihoeflea sp. PC F10.4]
MPPYAEIDPQWRESLASLDSAEATVVGRASHYLDGHVVPPHSHERAQLLYARSGVVLVSSAAGRWMVPPEHAMWIPAGVAHSVEMMGAVAMRSVYLRPEAARDAPRDLAVLAMTDLMRALVAIAVEAETAVTGSRRDELAMGLLVEEIARLPQRPLALPLPSDRRLLALCRAFLAQPAHAIAIDEWASRLGMSRRSFTRFFQRQTGVSLGLWRQQACLFAALPRLAEGESVTAVALDLGYDSVPAFTTMFSRMLGTAPRAYFRTG